MDPDQVEEMADITHVLCVNEYTYALYVKAEMKVSQ